MKDSQAGEMSQDELDDFSRICEAADDCEKNGLEFKIRPRREEGIWTEQVCCYCGNTTGSEDLICPDCLAEISGYEGEYDDSTDSD